MNIPSNTLKTLLSALMGKSPSAAGEPMAPEPAAVLTVGREINAEVIERQPNGRYLVRAGGELFDMPLPGKLRPGSTIRLTYVGDTPRLTFSLSSPVPKGTDVSISSAGRWLGTLATDLQSKERPVTAQPARPPLISGELPLDRPQIAARLRDTVSRSGLFYESHLARWREGKFPLAELLQEPQAQESPILKGTPAGDPLPAGQKAQADVSPQSSTTRTIFTPLPATPVGERHAAGPNGDQPEITAGASGAGTASKSELPITQKPLEMPASAETPPSAAKPEPSRASVIPAETAAPEIPQQSGSSLPAPPPPAAVVTPEMKPPDQGSATARQAAEAEAAPPPANRTDQTSAAPDQAAPTLKSGISSQPAQLPATPWIQVGDTEESRLARQKQAVQDGGETASQPHRAQQPPLPAQHDAQPPNRTLPLVYGEPPATSLPDRPPREAFLIPGDRTQPPSFEPPPPQTLPVIRQQLEFLQSGQFVWQGEAWRGQQFEWKIGREERKKGDTRANSWETSLNLELPNLGRISAQLHLTGGDLRISVVAGGEPTAGLMEREKGKLAEGMEAAGLRLTGMEVHREPSS